MAGVANLSESQNTVFQRIIASIPRPSSSNENAFLIKGAAGTGKTFLLNQIIRHCENQDIKAIALAYTGIASCILLKGKTVHSQFRIPWSRQQITCGIDSTHPMYGYIKEASVIAWDQASFCSRSIIEEVNRYLQIMMNSQRPFGGKVVIMCADFRECSPIAKVSQTEPPESHSLLFSALYNQMQHFTLHENLRFTYPTDYRWCLDIGSGAINEVYVPNECRVFNLDTLISSIYGHDYGSIPVDDTMGRSILAVSARGANDLNRECLNRLFQTKYRCESINYFKKIDEEQRSRFYIMDNVMANLPKYFPPNVLFVSENCPIMLRQAYRGLAPGTRLIVRSVAVNKIIAEIGVGRRRGRLINIYRTLTRRVFASGNVQFIRRQFPVSLAFALTINKAQGLEFKRLGVHFDSQVFSHGQMYVAFSRVSDIKLNIKVLITEPNDAPYDSMPNVVNRSITNHL